MYKDSAIWISVTAILGIEAIRALITKDSVQLLDKQNKIYTARSIDYLQEVTGLPLNLSTLQDLIIGNPVYFDNNIVAYSKNGNTISLLSNGKWFKNLLTVDASNKTLLHSKMDDVNMSRNRTADLTYADYDAKLNPSFSTTREITVVENNKLNIILNFKQYDFNSEVSFPFPIPKNYTRK
jgi:outer membrane biogenesis lipoprotein LolB